MSDGAQSVGCSVGDIGDQFNGGAVTAKGVELSASATPTIGEAISFPISVAYTFTDAQFDSNFESEFFGSVSAGDALPYLARHQLYAETGVVYGPVSMTLGANYVSKVRTEAGSGPIPVAERVDDRIIFDLAGRFAVTDEVSLFARIDNLLDETYAVARQPTGLRPGAPRRFVGGASLRF